MPVLDGVEATRAIRQSEARGTRLPIIALTAHALPADRERFRAAGLDDILVTPISRNGVRATLATFLGQGAAHPPAPAQNAASLLDSAHLDSLAETLGPEKTDAIVNEFIAEMTTAVADISHRLETGDTGGALCEEIHHAAGSAALIGTEMLRGEMARLEERLKEGHSCDAEDANHLGSVWRNTLAELKGYLTRL